MRRKRKWARTSAAAGPEQPAAGDAQLLRGAVCHVGGPAWCLDWAPPPPPDADGAFTQLLAVGAARDRV